MSAPKRKQIKQPPVGKTAQFKAVSLRITPQLYDKVASAAAETGLTVANAMRLSIERGIQAVVEQLTTPT